jgi:transglutaminase-like putative cysteine protease
MKHLRTPLFGTAAILALAWALSAFGQDAAGDADKHFKEAQELAKGQKFDEAIAAIKKAIELAPRNDLYLATASDYEFRAGRYADGLEHALQAIKINDKVGAYYALVAANAIGTQDLDRAREYCEIILKRGPKEFGAATCNDAHTILDRLTPRTYTLYWVLDPRKGRAVGGRLTVAVPKDGLPYQSVTYQVEGARSQRLVKGEINDVVQIEPDGKGPIKLTTKVTVRPYSYKKELAKATQEKGRPVPPETRAYLGPCVAVNPKSPALMKIAAGLKGTDNVETVRNILAWLKKNVKYRLEEPTVELDFKSVDELVERGHAECRGYALLLTALCRAADVPARPIWGLVRVPASLEKKFGQIASHNWTEFYVPGCGWVPIDPQYPETLGFLPTTCIRIFMDAQRSKTSPEVLPLRNLVLMNGEKLKFDEAAAP